MHVTTNCKASDKSACHITTKTGPELCFREHELNTFHTTSIAFKDVWNSIVIFGGAIAHASARRLLLARPVKP